jgi:CDP-diacylglycerol---serine O-phosphatidyltransferase
MSYMREENGLDTSIALLVPAFLVSCAGAYRLARFNIDTTQSHGFKGVPIPAVGILVASFPLILHYNSGTAAVNALFVNKWVLYGIIGVVSWLMISKLPMMALKFKDYSIKNNIPKIILLAVSVLAAIFFKWLAVPIIFVVYIILSLLLNKKQS